MTWTESELASMSKMRQFYYQWIKSIEAGEEEGVARRREYGRLVDDLDDALARYRRNVAEIEEILTRSGHTLD